MAPRLFVIMAARARVAVVVKRGPAAWAQLVLWDTQRDVFQEGAWLRGRIYEEKCDVSPDGELFVYAAHQGRRLGTRYTDSYTAVSRPPWLHALALWPMGTTYGGGGRFVGPRSLTLRGATETHPDHPARGLSIVPGVAERQRSSDEVAGVEWCGRDQSGRLVYTNEGRIFAKVEGADAELVRFDRVRPDPQPAPAWATRPLGGPKRGR